MAKFEKSKKDKEPKGMTEGTTSEEALDKNQMKSMSKAMMKSYMKKK